MQTPQRTRDECMKKYGQCLTVRSGKLKGYYVDLSEYLFYQHKLQEECPHKHQHTVRHATECGIFTYHLCDDCKGALPCEFEKFPMRKTRLQVKKINAQMRA